MVRNQMELGEPDYAGQGTLDSHFLRVDYLISPSVMLKDHVNLAIIQVIRQLQDRKLQSDEEEFEEIYKGNSNVRREELLRFFHQGDHTEVSARLALLERAQTVVYESAEQQQAQSPKPWEETPAGHLGFRLTEAASSFLMKLAEQKF